MYQNQGLIWQPILMMHYLERKILVLLNKAFSAACLPTVFLSLPLPSEVLDNCSWQQGKFLFAMPFLHILSAASAFSTAGHAAQAPPSRLAGLLPVLHVDQ